MRLAGQILGLAMILTLAAVVGCTPSPSARTTDWEGNVGDFALVERSGRTLRRDDLHGKVWVAAFVFTCCEQSCPVISGNMRQLQQDWSGYDGVVLVSFSVDPVDDTPERLRAYADAYGADKERWLFLTGDQEAIYELSRQSFHQHVGENPDPYRSAANKVEHGNNLFLVDRQGRIRGHFDATSNEDLAILRKKVRMMVSPLPTVNAGLNGLAFVLLLVGFVAIRMRKVFVHQVLMLVTLGVSAAFLGSYLYYHIIICGGEPTRFRGEGGARVTYLLILGSHTILATIVAPLALFTAFQGLRGRLARHVRVARWTLPIWLYVSVTGVVVYWMLYHLYPVW